jgi:putative DNA primase/helicase
MTRYFFSIDRPANGRSSKHTVFLLDENKALLDSDKGDLAAAKERQRLAKRFAKGREVDPEALETTLSETYLALASEPDEPPPMTAADDGAPHKTDVGNGRRLAQARKDEFRHCHVWGKDVVWAGSHWTLDHTGQVERWAKETVQEIYREALAETSNDERHKALVAHALRSEDVRHIRGMVSLARSEPGVSVVPQELDRDPWALNLPNGTLDLRSGQLRPHRRADYLTKLCPTRWEPTADCPRWKDFLDSVFQADQDVITFVQRYLGYCLTGDVREQMLPVFWGFGSNGKSTLLRTVQAVLGADYVVTAGENLLIATDRERHPTELVPLFGARLVLAAETEEGASLNEKRVKGLTGGEPITARRMYENPWSFEPTHKIILVTNYRPKIRGKDYAIRRRVRLVPFSVTYWRPEDYDGPPGTLDPELTVDPQLPDRLLAEAPGILRWMVEGCMDWQGHGLGTPRTVLDATAEYFSGKVEESLKDFLGGHCTRDKNDRASVTKLFAAFKTWCAAEGKPEPTAMGFGLAMQHCGFEKNPGKRYYLGLRLNEEPA